MTPLPVIDAWRSIASSSSQYTNEPGCGISAASTTVSGATVAAIGSATFLCLIRAAHLADHALPFAPIPSGSDHWIS
jgi:hypothetical protein